MTKETFAAEFNGIEYPFTVPKHLAALAKTAGIVIVYGASDDLMEFDGAIHGEIGVYGGGTAFLVDGKLWGEEPDCDCQYAKAAHQAAMANGKAIEALWCAEAGYSWTYKTDIPHVTFEIVEDGEPYCRGIIFDLKDALM